MELPFLPDPGPHLRAASLKKHLGRAVRTGNIVRLLSNSSAANAFLLLNILHAPLRVGTMRQMCLLIALLAACTLAGAGHAAECYADYKAKQDNPLRLHYGVAEVSQCSKQAARSELAPRLARQGWTLLNIVSVFDKSGLAERKDSAGPNYLRY